MRSLSREDLPPSIAMVLKDLAFHPAEKASPASVEVVQLGL